MNDVVFASQQLLPAFESRHQHDSWEIFYCTADAGTVHFDEVEFPCRAGDVVIIPPNTPHTHVGAGEGTCIALYLTDAALAFRYPQVLQDDDLRGLLHLFSDTHTLFHSRAAYRSALLPAYGQLIAQHISTRRTASPRNLLVEEIAQHIVQNYANPNYELDELLKSAPYCYDYLCRLFRQEMHTTPHKYLTNLRLQAAADILRGGNGSSVTEIARMCGYNDPLYFSRMFKKRYGISPREYARQPHQE